MSQPSLIETVQTLADALAVPTDEDVLAKYTAKIAFDDLDNPEAVPDWLHHILRSLASGSHVPPWQPLPSDGDLTDSLDFFRTLDQILPVELIDVGDNYTVIARSLGLEAVITLVGYGYCVRPIDEANL